MTTLQEFKSNFPEFHSSFVNRGVEPQSLVLNQCNAVAQAPRKPLHNLFLREFARGRGFWS